MNDTTINMIQMDSAPARTFAFTRNDGATVDLTLATSVNLNIIRPDTDAKTNSGNSTCIIQSPKTAGQAVYNWNAGDLPVAGVYRSIITIAWSDGTTESDIVYIAVESNAE